MLQKVISMMVVVIGLQNISAANKASKTVTEAATSLPLAYDVDVVVAGGTLPGVEAACAAAKQGASVLLVESRPYIGYDMCATQKLWLDSDETPVTALSQTIFKEKRVVTPLEIKRELDGALLENNVAFLTGTFPAELLVGQDGAPAGLTVVNRSGRQAVRAKVVIDATPDAVLTRQSKAQFKPFKKGPKEVQFIVVGGKRPKTNAKELPNVTFVAPSKKNKKQKDSEILNKNYSVFEYTVSIENETDTFRSRSLGLNQIKSQVYDSTMADHSERLLYFPDNPIIPAVSPQKDSVDTLPLDTFRPQGIETLFVLSAYAGASDSARRVLHQSPTSLAPHGERIGVAAAKLAQGQPKPEGLQYTTTTTGNPGPTIAEVRPSFRFRHCPQLELSAHELPVLGRWDVVVVGGGTSGAPAALGAARSGAKTLLIEYMDELGGVGTAGMIASYWYGLQNGFTAEIDKGLDIKRSWWPMQKSEWLRAELLKNNVEIWFSSFGCGAVMKGNKASGIVVATPFGRGVILADVVIDGTGNSDIPAAAGADTQYSISALGDLTVQVAGYPDRGLEQRQNNSAYAMIKDTDILDRTHFLLTARINGGLRFKNPYDMGQLLDTRDRRRIVGDYTLTTQDILTHRSFPDTISHHRSNFDAGALPDDLMFLIKDMKGPIYLSDMPYRCLTPKGLEGMLVTGLSASAHRDAMTLTRMQPDLQNQGYAVGMAAALAVRTTGGLVREIDLKKLQQDLVQIGCLEERVLTDTDSFPMSKEAISEAILTLHALTIDVHQKDEHDDTLPALAVVMGNPEQSLPVLKAAYEKADKSEVKINFARILAILGDSTGKETLLKAVSEAKDWGKGWDFSGQRKLANSFGEIDRLVIALGFIRSPEVHAALLRKLETLKANSYLSHYKAICLALRLNKDVSLAEPIARLLNKEGVSGHVQPLSYYTASNGQDAPVQKRLGLNDVNKKFREVLLAALLYECGDYNGQARDILEAYTQDVNGHFAAYAHLLLSKGTALASK
ncbi:MAG: FAD-dependent oxidoreductase [Verrucomicrobiota bacterium]